MENEIYKFLFVKKMREFLLKTRGIFNPQDLLNLIEIQTFPTRLSKQLLFGWWQEYIKFDLVQGGTISWITGRKLDLCSLQLHHSLITKADIIGIKDDRKYLIHHSYNLILTDYQEHLQGQDGIDNRELCTKILCNKYGKKKVREWYCTFPRKVPLPNIFNDVD